MKILRYFRFLKRYLSINAKFIRNNLSLRLVHQGLKDHVVDDHVPEYEHSVINRIINSYNYAENDLDHTHPAYQPGHKWKPQNEEYRSAYIQALRCRDVFTLAKLFRNFFRNHGVISILKGNLIEHVLSAKKILSDTAKKELTYQILRDLKTWRSQFPNRAITELSLSGVGNPFGCEVDGTILTGSSCSLDYYAYRINELLSGVPNPLVAEIGGGFGGLLYYLMKLNSTVKCVNFDLPIVLVIAQYYLMMSYPGKRFLLYDEARNLKKICFSEWANNDVILLPNFSLPLLDTYSIDVFFNIHSLSEMNYQTMEEYIKQIRRVTKRYFFHENSEINKEIGYGYREVTAAEFPIPPSELQLINRRKAIWNETRYCEYLYKKVEKTP